MSTWTHRAISPSIPAQGARTTKKWLYNYHSQRRPGATCHNNGSSESISPSEGIPRTALLLPGRDGAGARLDSRVVGGVDVGISGLFLKNGKLKIFQHEIILLMSFSKQTNRQTIFSMRVICWPRAQGPGPSSLGAQGPGPWARIVRGPGPRAPRISPALACVCALPLQVITS